MRTYTSIPECGELGDGLGCFVTERGEGKRREREGVEWEEIVRRIRIAGLSDFETGHMCPLSPSFSVLIAHTYALSL